MEREGIGPELKDIREFVSRFDSPETTNREREQMLVEWFEGKGNLRRVEDDTCKG